MERKEPKEQMILLGNRMEIPANTQAILWDMDGTLIDSLGLDLVVVNDLLKQHFADGVEFERGYIQSIFDLHVPQFWQTILDKVVTDFGAKDAKEKYEEILASYNSLRQNYRFELCDGVREILDDAKNRGLSQAVVSNNPVAHIEEILANVGILNEFRFIVGNDIEEAQKLLRKKPYPDPYIYAAKLVGFTPSKCAAVEDAINGVESAKSAGCFTIGVATGGATWEQLIRLGDKIDRVYSSFSLPSEFQFPPASFA